MGKFNLNKELDFARATSGQVGAILNTLVRSKPSEWDLFEGSYAVKGFVPQKFHVLEGEEFDSALAKVEDQLGRRKVKYQFPYRDGQTTDDLGRKPASFIVNCLFHGNNYLVGLTNFLTELDDPRPGDLVHPIRGQLTVVPEDFSVIYESSSRKAAAVSVTFIEHNFTIGEFTSTLDTTVKGKLAAALEVFATIQNSIANIQGAIAFVNSVKAQLVGLYEALDAKFGKTLGDINVTFNPGAGSPDGSIDIPTLLPINEGGTEPGGVFPIVTSPSDPFASAPIEELATEGSVALATQRLANDVNDLRDDVEATIVALEDAPTVDGSKPGVTFAEDVLAIKRGTRLMTESFEAGVAASRSQVISFEVPKLMSVREVAFANGLTPDEGQEIIILNPDLESINFIEKGTVLLIPVD